MQKIWRSPWLVILAATALISISVGTRSTFGLFLRPMTLDLHWTRESFALAIAISNLVWGLVTPFTGMLADRYGSGRMVALGGMIYVAGLYVISISQTPLMFMAGMGVLVGLGISSTSFAVVLGAVGRAVPAEKRSLAMGIASAGGSVGQFVMLPIGQSLISRQGWSGALIGLAVIVLIVLPLSTLITGRASPEPGSAKVRPARALRQAAGYGSYWLLFWGYFVCGFQVTFIGTHLPAYLVDNSVSPEMGATALAMIGFFNILGSFSLGALGGRYSKKRVLSGLYLARAVAILVFVSLPLTSYSILGFAAVVGFLWLATVPLTTALVGQMFGVRYLSTLSGFVFLGHQLGAFLGVWLGGLAYDLTHSYTPVWYAAVALGVFAAIVHWPINERSVEAEMNPVIQPAQAD